jgi:hypothetical protein
MKQKVNSDASIVGFPRLRAPVERMRMTPHATKLDRQTDEPSRMNRLRMQEKETEETKRSQHRHKQHEPWDRCESLRNSHYKHSIRSALSSSFLLWIAWICSKKS